ncbi:MAG: polymer-forming cytoskeletal protein [Candidatus Poribacteria bacterium]|nr:polymer-forming cytoskeletal protein [Candidatus Poribacteria bacterium]
MKETGFIFLLFSFGAMSIFGQFPNNKAHVSDLLQQSNFEQKKSVSGDLIAQGGTGQETTPTNLTEEEDSEHAEQPMSGSEDTADESTRQAEAVDTEKIQRIFKVVNDYQLAADETLTTLVVIAGNVALQGHITGNVLIIGGDIELTPASQVNGTLHVIGGHVTGNIEGVANLEVNNDWQMVPAAVRLVMHTHIFWGISKQTNFRLTFVKFGLFLLMYLLIVALFPKPINAVSELFGRRPIGSIIFGILILAIIPLLFAALTLSIVGVPFMLLVLSFLIPLSICGKAAIFLTLGGTLFSGRWRPLAVIFSYTLYFMATALPYVDWMTFLIVNAIGIGLCLLKIMSMMRPETPHKSTYPLPGSGQGTLSERV